MESIKNLVQDNAEEIKSNLAKYLQSTVSPSIIRSVRDNVAKVLKDKRVKVYPDSVYKIFLPFKLTPIHSVNVVLIGYEPYPYSGYSTGLAFANPVGMPKYSPTLEAIKECVYSDYYQENYFDMPFGDPYEYQFDYSLKSLG